MPEEAVKLDKPRHGDIRQVHSDEGVYPRLTDAHGLQIPHQTVGISVSGRLGSVQVMRGWVGSYSPDQDGMCNFASSDTRPPRRQGSDNNQSQRVMRVQMSIRLDIGINVRAFCGYISPQVRCEMDNRIHVKDLTHCQCAAIRLQWLRPEQQALSTRTCEVKSLNTPAPTDIPTCKQVPLNKEKLVFPSKRIRADQAGCN